MKKILVIDDEEWLREMVQLALTQKGYDVIEAGNGVKGIEIARKELPDLVLCDVNMEKLDGYGALSSLRSDATTASIPFILMTGLADNAGMRHGMELGADDYLAKPFTIDALYAAVEARLKKASAVRKEADKRLEDLRDNITLILPHELRTPLNGILAYGEILASDAAHNLSREEIAEMGQVIQDSGRRLEHLVENFLIYAQLEIVASDHQKIGALRTKQTPLGGALVERVAREQAALVNRLADLELQIFADLVPMSEEYFAKIVGELTQNAFKFSSPRTKVIVKLAEFPDAIILTVIDHGQGFETEHISKVGAYMQFNRKIKEQQGLGLGLGIVKRLAELHGGTFTIQSRQGAETKVTLRLPK